MPAPLVPSGLAAVDARWGGLTADGTYLLVGRADGGRSALALQFVRGAVDAEARCLLISPRAPQDLVALATSVGLDLGDAHKTGRLRLLRIPAADALAQRGSDGLDTVYREFVTLVRTDRPDRVVIEDFTPLVQFDSFDRFEAAFQRLADDVSELGATLVVGLGEPANSTSRQLLDVVKRHVDASVELDTASRQIRLTRREAASLDAPPSDTPPEKSPAQLAPASAPPTSAPPTSAPPTSAPPVSAPPVSAPSAPPPSQPTAPASLPTGAPVGDDPAIASPSTSATPSTPVEEAPAPAPQETTAEAPPTDLPPSEAPASAVDLASAPVETATEASDDATDPFVVNDPDNAPAADDTGYPVSGVSPAPPADVSLLGEVEDRFGIDPSSVLSHGYLVDSGALSPPDRPAAPPSFAPLGEAAAKDPAAAFRSALDHSFSVRVTGTPFLVVAVRMETTAPEAIYFPTVADGLRGALRPQDRILVDEDRGRAVVLLPASQTDAAQALFTGLQDHLGRSLDDAAGGVLRAVGAVSVPDGQPFTSSRDLMAYAFED